MRYKIIIYLLLLSSFLNSELLYSQNLSRESKKMDSNGKVSEEKNVKSFSLEIYGGELLTLEHKILADFSLHLPRAMWRLGSRILFQPNLRILISLNSSYSRYNFMVATYPENPFPAPEFSINQFSLQAYLKMSLKNKYYYIGGGLSILKTRFYLNGKNSRSFYLMQSFNVRYNENITPSIYISIQGDIYFKSLEWGSPEMVFNNVLPAINLGLGYRF